MHGTTVDWGGDASVMHPNALYNRIGPNSRLLNDNWIVRPVKIHITGIDSSIPLERWLGENLWMDKFGIQNCRRGRSNHIYKWSLKKSSSLWQKRWSSTLQNLKYLFIYHLYFITEKLFVHDTAHRGYIGLSLDICRRNKLLCFSYFLQSTMNSRLLTFRERLVLKVIYV